MCCYLLYWPRSQSMIEYFYFIEYLFLYIHNVTMLYNTCHYASALLLPATGSASRTHAKFLHIIAGRSCCYFYFAPLDYFYWSIRNKYIADDSGTLSDSRDILYWKIMPQHISAFQELSPYISYLTRVSLMYVTH